jgi:hypothetical protein
MREWSPPTWLRVLTLRSSPVWKAAKEAVEEVRKETRLNEAASRESRITFCPRCGQRPSGDRRFEEARERAVQKLGDLNFRRRDLDYAISWHYWSGARA